MSLYEVRKTFVKDFTGRYDLVVEGSDYADNGADAYINVAQRWLDRKVGHKKSSGSFFLTLPIGSFYGILTDARSVQEVWASTNLWRRELWKLDRQAFRERFPTDYSQIGIGMPIYYTAVNFRSSPTEAQSFRIDQIGSIIYSSDLGTSISYNGILVLPPCSEATTLEVVGLFYTPKLVNDTDQSFWTEQEPLILAAAAARQVEISMRNTAGVSDYESAIQGALDDMDKDLAEEESVGINTLGGYGG